MVRAASMLAPLLGRMQGTVQLSHCAPVQYAWQHLACAQHTQQRAASTNIEGPGSSGTGSNSVFVLNVEGNRNVSPLLIGIFNYLERYLPRPGFFQVCDCTPISFYSVSDIQQSALLK